MIAHSLASPSLVTEVVHNKYELNVPGYRQIKDWEQRGLTLSEQTISNWRIKSADWLRPLNELCRSELMGQSRIHDDETTYQVLREPGKAATTKSFLWLICSTLNAKRPVVYFKYDLRHSGAVAQKLYDGF